MAPGCTALRYYISFGLLQACFTPSSHSPPTTWNSKALMSWQSPPSGQRRCGYLCRCLGSATHRTLLAYPSCGHPTKLPNHRGPAGELGNEIPQSWGLSSSTNDVSCSPPAEVASPPAPPQPDFLLSLPPPHFWNFLSFHRPLWSSVIIYAASQG